MRFKDFKGAWPPDAGSRWEKEEAVRTELIEGYDENILFLLSTSRSPQVGASVRFPVHTVYVAAEEPCSLTLRDLGLNSIEEVTSVRVKDIDTVNGRQHSLTARTKDDAMFLGYFPADTVKVVKEREL